MPQPRPPAVAGRPGGHGLQRQGPGGNGREQHLPDTRALHQAKLPANVPGTHRGSGADRSSDTQGNIPASERKPLSLPDGAKASDSATGMHSGDKHDVKTVRG